MYMIVSVGLHVNLKVHEYAWLCGIWLVYVHVLWSQLLQKRLSQKREWETFEAPSDREDRTLRSAVHVVKDREAILFKFDCR